MLKISNYRLIITFIPKQYNEEFNFANVPP